MNSKITITIDESLLGDSETLSATIRNTDQLVKHTVDWMKTFNAQVVIVRESERVASFATASEFFQYMSKFANSHKPKQS